MERGVCAQLKIARVGLGTAKDDGRALGKAIPIEEQDGEVPALCQLGVRPEDIQPASDGQFTGEIFLTEPLGVETVLHIKSGGQTLLSTQSGITYWEINFDGKII